MSEIASRKLRNDTAAVLRCVRDGEEVTITVNGQPVAVLTAVGTQRRSGLSKAELLTRLRRAQADPMNAMRAQSKPSRPARILAGLGIVATGR